jgi:predicted transcriptional regulator
VDRVKEIIALNKKGVKPATLFENVEAEKEDISTINSDLERLDKKFSSKNKKKKKRKNRNNRGKKGPGGGDTPTS